MATLKSEARNSKSLAQTWHASCRHQNMNQRQYEALFHADDVAPGQAETNSKYECSNVQNIDQKGPVFRSFEIGSLNFALRRGSGW
jgi:hypothetical protein